MKALELFDYSGNCWWCSRPADSAEHKYKRTDIASEFGRGSYRRESTLIRHVDGELVAEGIQGPNSAHFKFAVGLCRECNTTRSREIDLAYESVVRCVRRSEHDVLRDRRLDFALVFGHDWSSALRNVRRYFAKHACSRIVDAGRRAGDDLLTFLSDRGDDKVFSLEAEIRTDIIEGLGTGASRDGSLWLGDLIGWHAPEDMTMVRVQSHYGVGWLRFNWVYDPLGRDWPDNLRTQVVALPERRAFAPSYDQETG
jgi:hypothetical protein